MRKRVGTRGKHLEPRTPCGQCVYLDEIEECPDCVELLARAGLESWQWLDRYIREQMRLRGFPWWPAGADWIDGAWFIAAADSSQGLFVVELEHRDGYQLIRREVDDEGEYHDEIVWDVTPDELLDHLDEEFAKVVPLARRRRRRRGRGFRYARPKTSRPLVFKGRGARGRVTHPYRPLALSPAMPASFDLKLRRKPLPRGLQTVLTSPRDVGPIARHLAAKMELGDREWFLVLALDSRLRVEAWWAAAAGWGSLVAVFPAQVLGPALALGSPRTLIIAHNHPSGDPSPSEEDIQLTHRLVAAAELVGLQVSDHLILGRDGMYASLAELGYLDPAGRGWGRAARRRRRRGRADRNHPTAKTAIARGGPSAPVRELHRRGLIKGRVLDFGSGRGEDAKWLRSQGFQVASFDPHHGPKRLPSGTFDTVLSTYVLNVLPQREQDKAVAAIRRKLAPGGEALVTVRRDICNGEPAGDVQSCVKRSWASAASGSGWQTYRLGR